MFWHLVHLGNYFCDPPVSRTTETKSWKWRTDIRPCCFVGYWMPFSLLSLEAEDTGGLGKKGGIWWANSPCLDLSSDLASTTRFMQFYPTLKLLVKRWTQKAGRDFNICLKFSLLGPEPDLVLLGLDSTWKGQRATNLWSHNLQANTHTTRQSQSSSYQALHPSSKYVLENSLNIACQSIFTTSWFLCWIHQAHKSATAFAYLTVVYFR